MKKRRLSFSRKVPFGTDIDTALRLGKKREARHLMKKSEGILEVRFARSEGKAKAAHSPEEKNQRDWHLRIVKSHLERVRSYLKDEA